MINSIHISISGKISQKKTFLTRQKGLVLAYFGILAYFSRNLCTKQAISGVILQTAMMVKPLHPFVYVNVNFYGSTKNCIQQESAQHVLCNTLQTMHTQTMNTLCIFRMVYAFCAHECGPGDVGVWLQAQLIKILSHQS